MDSTLSLIGLALRAGKLAVGEEPCALVCRARDCRLLLLASDAGASTLRRAQRMAEEGQCLTLTLPWDREALGGALGRNVCAVAAVTDLGLAKAGGGGYGPLRGDGGAPSPEGAAGPSAPAGKAPSGGKT